MPQSFSIRPALGSIAVCGLVTVWIMLTANTTLLTRVPDYFGGWTFPAIGFVVGLSLILLAVLVSLSARWTAKPALVFFLIVAASASWFTDKYGVIIDRGMIQNTLETNPDEAGQFLTGPFIFHMVLFGLLPSIGVAVIRIRHRPWRQKLLHNSAVIFPALGIFTAITFIFFQTYASMLRNHRDLPMTFTPLSPIVKTVDYFQRQSRMRGLKVQPLGTDARKSIDTNVGQSPKVLVLMVGETARAQNFSLNGYERETDPRMKTAQVVNFPDVSSCGTATNVSLPCMFSIYGRADYTEFKGRSSEHLLDVLQHAGFKTTWIDNNITDKRLGQTSEFERTSNVDDPRFCKDGECRDGILVDRLQKRLSTIKEDTVIVLHMNGSHGPAYYRRYPESHRKFRPDCRTDDFSSCSVEEIVNAYDNTILYTDQVIGDVIDILKQDRDKVASAMLFISDHGESLGENGLFLHAAPYFMAPEFQTRVPMMLWAGDEFLQRESIEPTCLQKAASNTLSHDNLFHSVLGLLNVSTSVRSDDLDIFSRCRKSGGTLAGRENYAANGG
ncbi:MAG: phosphoethanolamine--lipid A transferase [Ahrensia sp.]|nr:phosphoethanolamine--lipid A transferase [Ahrensia sp.]